MCSVRGLCWSITFTALSSLWGPICQLWRVPEQSMRLKQAQPPIRQPSAILRQPASCSSVMMPRKPEAHTPTGPMTEEWLRQCCH